MLWSGQFFSTVQRDCVACGSEILTTLAITKCELCGCINNGPSPSSLPIPA